MKCVHCNTVMVVVGIEKDKQILFCPHCGYKEKRKFKGIEEYSYKELDA